MTLYQYAKLTRNEQVEIFALLKAEIDADRLANKPTLVKEFYLRSMYHVMTGRTRKHVHQLVDRGGPAPAAVHDAGSDADIGARFHAETLAALS